MPGYNKIQQVKRRFFAMRNGVIADTLRRSGLDYKIIFGLNLPQIAEIAAERGYDDQLALSLRDDVRCRESQLLAPMLVNPSTLTPEGALLWARSATTTETADIVCHRLLRRRPDLAPALSASLLNSGDRLQAYTALRLWVNLLAISPLGSEAEAEAIAALRPIIDATADTPLTRSLRRQAADEIEFRLP